MKELSIEEKAKAYDEALKVAKSNYETIVQMDNDCTFAKEGIINTFHHMFPELKESEDEKISKSIIAIINNYVDNSNTFKPEMIAWLEKQGEKDEEILVLKDQIESLHAAINAIKETYRIELEKQGEQKPVIEMKSAEESLGIDSETYNKIVDECIYGDVDKVEPKFKVGDFIVNDYCTGKVIELTNDAYLLDTGQGIPFSCEHNAHLWTIQDAKNGDVLVTWNNTTFIFKNIEDDVVKYYIAYNEKWDEKIRVPLSNDSHVGLAESQFEFKPATKEQRDLLFQKMKEAGYEWNDEKKELKRIEQKSIKNEELTEFDKAVGVSIGTWNPKTPEQIQSVKTVSKKLLKFAKKQINDEQKPAWSEEDENKLNEILHDIECSRAVHLHSPKQTFDSRKNWLKSLKDRVQPKQEWSEEDKGYIDTLIGILNKRMNCSDEGTMVYNVYKRAQDWLKSITLQNRWKPSDEHYELEEFAKIVRGNLTGISKAVQELFEAKYLQLTGNKMYGGYKD